jgi:hypothetical protein
MPWNPSEHNRVGELLGRGITDAGTSIADAITDAKQKHDELKGWKTLADALSKDPANGIDPASVDKMTLSQAKMLPLVAETRRAQVQNAQKQRSQMALRNVFGSLFGQTQPQPDLTGALMQGRGPIANPPMTPPRLTTAPGNQAILEGLNQNPDALNTPEGAAMGGDVLKGLLAQPKGNYQPSTTMPGVYVDPATGRPFQPRANAAPIPQDWQPNVKDINGVKMYQDKPNGTWKALPLSEQREGGGQPEMSSDGKFFRTGPMDAWKAMPRTQSTDDFVKLFGGGKPQMATDATDKGKAAAAAAPEVGEVRQGYSFKGGDPSDPANWEKVEE